jgi:hypothetical protein
MLGQLPLVVGRWREDCGAVAQFRLARALFACYLLLNQHLIAQRDKSALPYHVELALRLSRVRFLRSDRSARPEAEFHQLAPIDRGPVLVLLLEIIFLSRAVHAYHEIQASRLHVLPWDYCVSTSWPERAQHRLRQGIGGRCLCK